MNTHANCTRLHFTLSVTSLYAPVSVTMSHMPSYSPASMLQQNNLTVKQSISVNVLPCQKGLEYSNISGKQ